MCNGWVHAQCVNLTATEVGQLGPRYVCPWCENASSGDELGISGITRHWRGPVMGSSSGEGDSGCDAGNAPEGAVRTSPSSSDAGDDVMVGGRDTPDNSDDEGVDNIELHAPERLHVNIVLHAEGGGLRATLRYRCGHV